MKNNSNLAPFKFGNPTSEINTTLANKLYEIQFYKLIMVINYLNIIDFKNMKTNNKYI